MGERVIPSFIVERLSKGNKRFLSLFLTETSENSPILYRWWDESLPLIVLGIKEL